MTDKSMSVLLPYLLGASLWLLSGTTNGEQSEINDEASITASGSSGAASSCLHEDAALFAKRDDTDDDDDDDEGENGFCVFLDNWGCCFDRCDCCLDVADDAFALEPDLE